MTVTPTGAAAITTSTGPNSVVFSPVVQATNAGGNGSGTITVELWPDGSGTAVAGGNVQHSDFFTAYAPQNGQTYTRASFTGSISGTTLTTSAVSGTPGVGQVITGSGIPSGVYITAGSGPTYTLNAAFTIGSQAMTAVARPPWKVACVEYSCGYSITYLNTLAHPLSAYTLTAHGLKDPSVVANWALDGITYTNSVPAANTCGLNNGNTTAPTYIFCRGTLGGNIIGYDFGSFAAAGRCVGLSINNDVVGPGGVLTVAHNRFENGTDGTAYYCNSSANASMAGQSGTITSSDIVYSNNYCDVKADTAPPTAGPVQSCFLLNASNHNITANYNVFLHLHGRAIMVGTNGNKILNFNYAEGFGYIGSVSAGGAYHTELDEAGSSGGTAPYASQSFNTVLQPATLTAIEGTAEIYASAGAVGSTWTLYDATNNTLIVNLATSEVRICSSNNCTGSTNAANGNTMLVGPSGSPTTITFVTAAPSGNQVLIGANADATLQNLTTFAQGSADPNIAAFTWYKFRSNWVYAVGPAGNMNDSTFRFSTNWANIVFAQGPEGSMMQIAYDTYGTMNWYRNYLDPSGNVPNCILRGSPAPTVTTENLGPPYSINMLTGNSVTASTGACP
jgi:hypothetical protein